jgi:hypothetical protein
LVTNARRSAAVLAYSGSGVIRRRRFPRSISCGDFTPSMMVGMSAGNSRLRFGLERFSDFAEGIAMLPRIIAAGI